MAKRMRLTPPRPDFLAGPATDQPAPARSPISAPIAQVAGEAAAVAALADVAGELAAARAEGRLVQRLPLESIRADHLVRDRIEVDDAEMSALRDSLRARGQQTPIDVVALDDGRYGLISGWRRLRALSQLRAETGEPRFATVAALLRRPENAAAAYVAMVEENEIRVGLSYYERARIAARAARQGVYPDVQAALRGLFASASRAKRSKIGSFLVLHDSLGGSLRFPAAIGERLGLALSRTLEADPALGPRLRARLAGTELETAEAELAILQEAVAGAGARHAAPGEDDPRPDPPARAGAPASGPASDPASDPAPGPASSPAASGARAEEVAPGIYLETAGTPSRPRYTLSGPGIGPGFRGALAAWLATRR
jgi:ParB family transcriptional regulator, chromosome partitioning protein